MVVGGGCYSCGNVMQCDGYPQKENIEGAGGWDCKNEDSEAQICQNEHLVARFCKSKSWGVAGPAKMRMSKVWVAGTAKTRNSESWGMVGPAKSRTLKVLVA